jgi:hypothetical protein
MSYLKADAVRIAKELWREGGGGGLLQVVALRGLKAFAAKTLGMRIKQACSVHDGGTHTTLQTILRKPLQAAATLFSALGAGGGSALR